jgi:hypothetical protein
MVTKKINQKKTKFKSKSNIFNNLTEDSKILINYLLSLNKKDTIKKTDNLGNLLNYLFKNYNDFAKTKINLVKKPIESKNQRDVFLDNIDTCSRKSYKRDYLLNVEVILKFLNENHKELLLKMLNLHKYEEGKKKQLLSFIDNLGTYDKDYVFDWMNQNGIELMRSLYIFLLNNKLPEEVYKIVGGEREIYGEFTSLDIQEEIELSLPYKKEILYKMNNVELNLVINSKNKMKITEDFLRRSFFLSFLTGNSKDINIKLWLSKIKKYLPKPREDLFLGPKEVNSGCSSAYEITLWRKEEISKILIHEVIHHLSLERIPDLMEIQEYFYSKFDIKRNVRINFFESYTEMWTNILNIFMIGKNLKKSNKKSNKKSLNKTNDILKLLNIELLFSLFQCAKVLNFFGYSSFSEFYKNEGFSEEGKSDKFKQRSNVFSYYIGRTLLFYNFDMFLKMCYTYNINMIVDNKIPASKFIELMENTINNTDYISKIDSLIKIIKTRQKQNDLIMRTMRFTVMEVKI